MRFEVASNTAGKDKERRLEKIASRRRILNVYYKPKTTKEIK
jgi:ribosomal protein S15P/S13E